MYPQKTVQVTRKVVLLSEGHLSAQIGSADRRSWGPRFLPRVLSQKLVEEASPRSGRRHLAHGVSRGSASPPSPPSPLPLGRERGAEGRVRGIQPRAYALGYYLPPLTGLRKGWSRASGFFNEHLGQNTNTRSFVDNEQLGRNPLTCPAPAEESAGCGPPSPQRGEGMINDYGGPAHSSFSDSVAAAGSAVSFSSGSPPALNWRLRAGRSVD